MNDHTTPFFQHPSALVESKNIGSDTRIWAFAHVLPGAVIGSNCNICDHVFIESDVFIGDRVTIKCGVQLWDGIRLEDDVFVGPNATFTIDPFPRSKKYPAEFQKTIVHKGASIGANATILPGLTIGSKAMIGAGAVVTRDVPPNAKVVGNPARIVGYTDTTNLEVTPVSDIRNLDTQELSVKRARLIRLPLIRDLRGMLSFAEIGAHLPFTPKRYFVIFDVPNKEVRGEHAHHTLEEFLICVRGSCSVIIDDGNSRNEVTLDSPTIGLYVPPMVWRIHYKYSNDALLLALASDIYEASDYIRNYEEYLELANRQKD